MIEFTKFSILLIYKTQATIDLEIFTFSHAKNYAGAYNLFIGLVINFGAKGLPLKKGPQCEIPSKIPNPESQD